MKSVSSTMLTVACALACAACGDDGEPSDTSASTTTMTTGSPTSGTDPTVTATDPSTSASTTGGSTSQGPETTSTSDSTSAAATDTGPTAGSSTGGSMNVVLQNDGWEDQAQVAFQQGFAQDECWASVYVPPDGLGPFVVDGVSMLVGGDDMGEAEFSIGLWEVDADNEPMTEVGTGTTLLSGLNMGFDGTTMNALMIDSPVFEGQNFAIVVCLVAHGGFPAIGRDNDGTILDDRNWIRTTDGVWSRSADLGLTGDWIMRATVLTQ